VDVVILLRQLRIALVLTVASWAACAQSAVAEAMDLHDPRPRWVSVQFERSPPAAPGSLDLQYTRAFPAWFEPRANGELATVIVDADIVERFLFRDETPQRESFSDFVWEFDVETGHVTSARFSGLLSRPVRWGFVRSSTEIEIRVEMSTVVPAGYRAASRLFGNTLHRLCREPDDRECTLVDPRRLDRGTGYVNAVGALEAKSILSTVRTFSPLGEALFEEISDESLQAGTLDPAAPLPVESDLAPVATALPPNS
jgi:hypothetical protein